MGSRGGYAYSGLMGYGGGALQLTVAGTLNIAGTMTANGGDGGSFQGDSGGGSGGSLFITAGSLSGNGSISANGGNGGGTTGGGGAAGRIALYYTGADFPGQIQAYGGFGLQNGGAGTIYTKVSSQPLANLVYNNGGVDGAPSLLFGVPVLAGNVLVTGNATVSAPYNQLLQLRVLGNLTIDGGSSISVDNRSTQEYARGYDTSGQYYGAGGGGYGGNGGTGSHAGGGSTYGSITAPTDLGSRGGYAYTYNQGSGGGALQLTISGILTVNGTLSANGGDGWSSQGDGGGGSGGSILIRTSQIAGSGVISANGGNGGGTTGGGGAGGRIAYYCDTDSFIGVGILSAHGGFGLQGGGSGTIFTKVASQPLANLVYDNNGVVGAPSTLFGVPVIAGNLSLRGNAVLSTVYNQLLHLRVLGNLTIDSSSSLNADARSTQEYGRGYDTANQYYGAGGGGYGGIGGAGQNTSGGSYYGSATTPMDLGSRGGFTYSYTQGNGGGALRLTINGVLTVNGRLSANGDDARSFQGDSGGGSGGSLFITSKALTGTGLITSNGGKGGGTLGGGGGGGRIAFYLNSVTKFASKRINVFGGAGFNNGGAGTFFTQIASNTGLTVSVIKAVIGQTVTLKATLKRLSDSTPLGGKLVALQVNGVSVGNATTDDSGNAYVKYIVPDALGAGTFPITALFDGDADPSGVNPSSNGINYLTVNRGATTLAASNRSGKIGQSVTFTAVLRRNIDKGYVAGAPVYFWLDGTPIGIATTDKNGQAILGYAIPDSLASGVHNVSIQYQGDDNYLGSSANITLTVSAVDSYMTVTKATGAPGSTVTLKAQLRRKSDGVNINNRMVSFYVNGVLAGSSATLPNGVATLNYVIPSDAALGTQTIKATFAGDSAYNACVGTNTLTIK